MRTDTVSALFTGFCQFILYIQKIDSKYTERKHEKTGLFA